MDYIYLDNDSSTQVDPKVLRAMLPYFSDEYGMASSEFGHRFGVSARTAINSAKEIIARKINAKPEEIYFTSGVAESNNLAIQGAVSFKPGDMITSAIEQKTVLRVMNFLAGHMMIKQTVLSVDNEGFVNLKGLERAITKNTRLVSIQHANQEIGTIQDIEEIGALCKKRGVLFHTDASQSFLKEEIDVNKANVDLMTISAHNIYGPKGVAALYIKEGVQITPLFYGGGQQNGIRPGLENVAAIVGFAKAVEIYDKKDNKKMAKNRDYLIRGLLETKDTHLNGPDKARLCNNVNVSFKYVEGESLLLHADMVGIGVTTGSACFSRELTPSHVVTAIGGSHADAHGSVRFSLSKYNTKEEMDYVIKHFLEIVEKLREISPIGGN